VQAFLDSVESVMTPFAQPVRERMLMTADAEALAAATLVERPSF
jgi:hypothetical protein